MGGWHRGKTKCERSVQYTWEEVAVHMCGFDGIQRGNYFRGEPIGRAEVEVHRIEMVQVRMKSQEK